MACYHCNKLGHLANFCRSRNRKLVNSAKGLKDKQTVSVEEVKEEMNHTWKKKNDDSLTGEIAPSSSEENPTLVN